MCTCTQNKMHGTSEYSTYQCKTTGKYAFAKKHVKNRIENIRNGILISLQMA